MLRNTGRSSDRHKLLIFYLSPVINISKKTGSFNWEKRKHKMAA